MNTLTYETGIKKSCMRGVRGISGEGCGGCFSRGYEGKSERALPHECWHPAYGVHWDICPRRWCVWRGRMFAEAAPKCHDAQSPASCGQDASEDTLQCCSPAHQRPSSTLGRAAHGRGRPQNGGELQHSSDWAPDHVPGGREAFDIIRQLPQLRTCDSVLKKMFWLLSTSSSTWAQESSSGLRWGQHMEVLNKTMVWILPNSNDRGPKVIIQNKKL